MLRQCTLPRTVVDGVVPGELVRGSAAAAAPGAGQVSRGGVREPRDGRRGFGDAAHAQLRREAREHVRRRSREQRCQRRHQHVQQRRLRVAGTPRPGHRAGPHLPAHEEPVYVRL